MARVQLVISDSERDQFLRQAKREGMSFSAWLREAARARLNNKRQLAKFTSAGQIQDFFAECDTIPGPARELNWDEQLTLIDQSRRSESSSN